MIIEVILDSGYIEVHAWVDVNLLEIRIKELRYDEQQVRVGKLHPKLKQEIEEVAENEWAMGWDES